jgi:two-component system, LytTR family, sensor kinase
MNKTTVNILVQSPVVITVLSVVILMSSDAMHLRNTPFIFMQALTHAFWLLSGFYIFYLFLVPSLLEKGRYSSFALFSTLFVLILIPGGTMFLDHLSSSLAGLNNPSPDGSAVDKILFPWMGGIFGTIICGGLGTFYRFGVDWFNNLQLKKELENKNLQSELKILKSKLNPHLLFNTLNNIDSLIQTNPEQASVALTKLSDLLRYVVYETEKEKVPIQKEIENLQKYIDLEKIRLMHPESALFTSKVKKDITIPPMLFFPFIENAFKHSNLNLPAQRLKISLTEEKGKILFNCVNTMNDKIQKNDAHGLGLELAKKRLNLLYPDKHTITLAQVDNEFHVTLEIEAE